MLTKSAHALPSGTAPLVNSPLLKAEQVMELLGSSRTAFWVLMRTQGLPYIKLGKGRRASFRFSSDSVSRWLATREQQLRSV